MKVEVQPEGMEVHLLMANKKYVKPLDPIFFVRTENLKLIEFKERFVSIEYERRLGLLAVRMMTFFGTLYVKVNEKAVEISPYNRDTKAAVILELGNLGWGQDEIGAALGISQSAVSSVVITSRKTKNGKTDR